MSTLPAPPDPVEQPEPEIDVWTPARDARPGELTPAWRVVLGVAWAGVVLGLAAMWKSARTLGLSPWWLGPESNPRALVVQILPFVLPVAMVIATMRNLRHLPFLGMGTAVVVAAIATGDLDRSSGLAAVEFAMATAGLLASVAAIAGMYRPAVTSERALP
jgi:hypothetical protein